MNRPTSFEKMMALARADKAYVLATLGNFATLVIAPITAYLVIIYFSPKMQGFYYTFGSLLVWRNLADIGLSQTLIQFASHEWAGLRLSKNGYIIGAPQNLSRLSSLAKLSLRWYGISGFVGAGLLALIGAVIFSKAGSTGIAWKGPWFTLCFVSSISFLSLPIFSLIQGCGQVTQFWFYRLVQQVLSSVAICVAILSGLGLWSIVIAVGCNIVWSLIFLVVGYRRYILSLFSWPASVDGIMWRTEIWPVQWRIAVSWLAGSFTAQLFVPIIFKFSGPIIAGQAGLTISLGMLIYGITTNLLVTKAPYFGAFIARQNYKNLDSLFFTSFKASIVLAAISAAGASSMLVFLNAIKMPLVYRLLPPLPAALLFSAAVVSGISANLAVYLRAHKREPLAGIYLFTSMAIIAQAVLIVRYWGVLGVSAGYLGILVIIQLPLVSLVFKKSRRKWHGVDEAK